MMLIPTDDAYTSSLAFSLPARGLTFEAKLTLFVMLLILKEELTSYKAILKYMRADICD
jgi:hypothetical protein